MSSRIRVDVFAEDAGHSAILPPLVKRVAAEENVSVEVHVRSATGGAGRALEELEQYGRIVLAGGLPVPDVLVACVDANCATYPVKVKQIEEAVPVELWELTVVACPDPHIEKWYLADPDGLTEVFGTRPSVPRRKCERGRYKAALAQAVVDGGGVQTLGGIECAVDVAEAIDFYRAGTLNKSLQQFVSDLRAALHRASST